MRLLDQIGAHAHGRRVVGVRLEVRQADAPSEVIAFEFEQDRIVIGRGVAADVRLPHATVSVRHASLRLDGSRYVLVDHGSTNGTRIADQLLVAERPKAVRDGDVISVGAYRITFAAGVAVREPTSRERTASLARRLARLGPAGVRATPARLVVLNGDRKGHTLELPDPPARIVIGRGEDTDLPLPDADASREHCELMIDLDGAIVHDLASKNGVLVNDAKTTEKRLRDRDELTIGATVIAFEDPTDAVLAAMDATLDQPAPPLPAPVAPEPDTEPAREPERPIAAKPRPSLSRAEVFVAWLAAAVLLLSLSALYWLLR